MPIKRLFAVLRARWRLLLFTCLVTVAAVVAVSLAVPPQYKAEAAIVVEKNRVDHIAGRLLYPGGNAGYVATQIGILQSTHVARQVVRALDLRPDARSPQSLGPEEYEAWAAAELLKDLDVRPAASLRGEVPSDSAVLSVSYKSPDARLSSAVVNGFLDAYIGTTQRMKTDPARGYNEFFDARAKQLGEALRQAQERLSAYQKENGLIPTDEGIDVEYRRLGELNSQLVQVQDDLTAARNRATQARLRAREMPDVLSDEVVGALTKDLSLREARLNQLKAQFGNSYPEVVELRASIGALRARLDDAVQKASAAAGVAVKIAEGRLRQLTSALEEQRAKVVRERMQRDAGSVLVHDVQNARRAYDAVLARANETALESKNDQTNVYRLDAATPPLRPAWPILWLNTAVATVVGLLLGVFMAIFREARDMRLRTVDDVVVHLQQPVLMLLARKASRVPLLPPDRTRLLPAAPRGASAP